MTVTALGTARGLETTVVPAAGLELELIPPVPMPRRVGKDLALLGPRLIEAVTATVRLLRRTQADVVLGFGGYVSTPAYLAARRLGLPIVIHEQNVLPGLANRLAARLTSHVYTSFPQTALPHAHCIGLPMRRGITDLDRDALRREARSGFELHPELPTLLVSGGSQGAMRINTAVAGAWPELLAHGIQVLHVLGPRTSLLISAEPRRADRSCLSAGGVRGTDGAGLRGSRHDVGSKRRQHGAGDGRSGAPGRVRAHPHGNGEQARNAELVVAVAASCWPTATVRRPGWPRRFRSVCASGQAGRNEKCACRRCSPRCSYRVGVASSGGDPLMGLITPVELPTVDELGAVHFIAIGGSGMNGIAAMMLAQGIRVSGSDRTGSKYLRSLEAQGARSTSGTALSSSAMTTVVVSSAIGRTTPSWRRLGAAACGCSIAVRRWVC